MKADIWNYPPIPEHTGRFFGVDGKHYSYSPLLKY